MPIYHNSPNGPRICKALQGGCPYGRAGQPHFDSQIEAQKAYETDMNQQYGVVPKISKIDQARFKHYRTLDKNGALKNFIENPTPHTYAQYRKMSNLKKIADQRERNKRIPSKAGRGRGGSRYSPSGNLPTRILKRSARIATRGVKKSVRKAIRNREKILLTKYWMPRI